MAPTGVSARPFSGAAPFGFAGLAAGLTALGLAEAFLLEEGLLFIRKSKRLSTITTGQFFAHHALVSLGFV